MIRNKQVDRTKIIIDLTGPEGNAFALLSYAKSYCVGLGWEFEPIRKEMTSSDYENLIQVFDHHFGFFVILER